MNRLLSAVRLASGVVCVVGLLLPPPTRAADEKYVVKPVDEIKVKQVPRGPLYCGVENFPTADQAKAAAGEYRWNPDTVTYDGWPSLTAEVAGRVWLFILGPPMEVFNAGTTDLSALIMFAVDATKPFSTPGNSAEATTRR